MHVTHARMHAHTHTKAAKLHTCARLDHPGLVRASHQMNDTSGLPVGNSAWLSQAVQRLSACLARLSKTAP